MGSGKTCTGALCLTVTHGVSLVRYYILSLILGTSVVCGKVTSSTEIYTLSLHDALPISCAEGGGYEAQRRTTLVRARAVDATVQEQCAAWRDRKSTRLNSVTSLSRMTSYA